MALPHGGQKPSGVRTDLISRSALVGDILYAKSDVLCVNEG